MGIKDLDLRPTKQRPVPVFNKSAVPMVQKSNDNILDYFEDQLRASNDFTITAMALERGRAVSASEAFEFYRSNAAVATSVDMITDGVEQITPMEKKNDDIVGEHTEDIKNLMHPNGFETYQEFIGKICRHYLLTGNAYATLHGNLKRFPSAMFAPKPFFVQPQKSTDEYAISYLISEGISSGNYVRVGNEFTGDIRYTKKMAELIHLKRFSSRSDELLGDSPLTAAAIDTRQQIAGRIHNLGLLENGTRPSMIVNLSGMDAMTGKPIVVGMDELRERAKSIREQLSGKYNAGKIAVTTGYETKYQEIGTSNKDMDYSELDKIASEAIYRRYKIPLPLVMNQSATYNNVANAIAFFFETTVLPLADVIFGWMTRMLRMRGILDDNTIISYSPEAIPALMSKKLDEIKKRREIGVETINEIRESLPGRKPIEGGDTLYQPSNMMPVDEDLAMSVFGPDNMNESEDDGNSSPNADAFDAPKGVRTE